MRYAERVELARAAISNGRLGASGWVRATCPICPYLGRGEDYRNSLAYNTDTEIYTCNRCHTKGFLGDSKSQLPRKAKTDETPCVSDYAKSFIPAVSEIARTSIVAQPALQYLRDRGFTDIDVRRGDIHIAMSGKYAGRIIVPHKDASGVWWGFSARWYSKSPTTVKVLYPPGMSRTSLYNEAVLFEDTDTPVLVVEGALDATWYLPNVVAGLGKPGDDHIEKLCTSRRHLVFCLDGDAWEESRALMRRCALRGFTRTSYVVLPAGEDPNSVDPTWLWAESLSTLEKKEERQ